MSAQTVDQAIHEVKAHFAINGISKDRKNTEQRYNFRGIDDVLNALSEALVAHRLNILPRIKHKQTFEAGKTRNGASIYRTVVEAEYDLISVDDGSMRTVAAMGEAADSADKSGNKAMSNAYKYAMIQTFCIPTEGVLDEADYDHPEGDRNGGERREPERGRSNEAPQNGPTDAQLADFVEGAITDLKQFGVPDARELESYLADANFQRRANTVRERNPKLFQNLDHAIGMAKAAVDDVPF